ncbi:MAG: hypothetical protein U9M89_02230 [Patescibacteria group bacterium]|nr:hypothetical protein [Patescibacteria group bacterium]
MNKKTIILSLIILIVIVLIFDTSRFFFSGDMSIVKRNIIYKVDYNIFPDDDSSIAKINFDCAARNGIRFFGTCNNSVDFSNGPVPLLCQIRGNSCYSNSIFYYLAQIGSKITGL